MMRYRILIDGEVVWNSVEDEYDSDAPSRVFYVMAAMVRYPRSREHYHVFQLPVDSLTSCSELEGIKASVV